MCCLQARTECLEWMEKDLGCGVLKEMVKGELCRKSGGSKKGE